MRLFAGVLVAGALALAGVAHAQPGLSTKPDYDLTDKSNRVDENTQRALNQLQNRAMAALQAKDYAGAEAAFAELQRRGRTNSGVNFMMGLAKIGLEKWSEAQPYLEAAVVEEPKRPEPKTRLGITYAKLNNIDAARQQRAALASLDAECKRSCKDAAWIIEGLALLDEALQSEAAANRVSAAALAAVAASPVAASRGFDPAAYSLVAFNTTDDLYKLLTEEGRCPPKKTAAPRQPCALILYRPTEDMTDARATNFKPVFKVENRKSIWAIHDKQLQKVRIEDLYFDNVDVIGQKRTTHFSVALVGNAENQTNCDKGLPCLKDLVAEDMFRMYGNMPDSVVKVIWGAGMEDVGTTRVR
ncbi:MAG TPA: hypothetical protein VFV70_00665 [Hyphomonadaceae bacterium]|nr:hypothetical protein [Hyphomonadaceae bacterium]